MLGGFGREVFVALEKLENVSCVNFFLLLVRILEKTESVSDAGILSCALLLLQAASSELCLSCFESLFCKSVLVLESNTDGFVSFLEKLDDVVGFGFVVEVLM